MSDPNYVTGSFSYYNADRDPTSSEPLIISGYLDPGMILFWKNTVTGSLFLLTNATADSPPILTWVKLSLTLNSGAI